MQSSLFPRFRKPAHGCLPGETRPRCMTTVSASAPSLLEFDSVAQAIAAHETPEYQEALRALGNSVDRDLRIIEGIE